MDSMISRQTQQDNAARGSFRVKVNVTHVVARYPDDVSVRTALKEARCMARVNPAGGCARALRALGLEP